MRPTTAGVQRQREMKATMSKSPPRDPIAALNQTLSEVIDEVLEVKQARWIVPKTHALHGQLVQLFDDLGTWARRLFEQADALGGSPLASMPTVAGRRRPNLVRGAA